MHKGWYAIKQRNQASNQQHNNGPFVAKLEHMVYNMKKSVWRH